MNARRLAYTEVSVVLRWFQRRYSFVQRSDLIGIQRGIFCTFAESYTQFNRYNSIEPRIVRSK